MMCVIVTLTACNKKEYINVPYEVKIPVKCKVPVTYCDFNRTTYTEVIDSLEECIVDLKKIARYANEQKKKIY